MIRNRSVFCKNDATSNYAIVAIMAIPISMRIKVIYQKQNDDNGIDCYNQYYDIGFNKNNNDFWSFNPLTYKSQKSDCFINYDGNESIGIKQLLYIYYGKDLTRKSENYYFHILCDIKNTPLYYRYYINFEYPDVYDYQILFTNSDDDSTNAQFLCSQMLNDKIVEDDISGYCATTITPIKPDSNDLQSQISIIKQGSAKILNVNDILQISNINFTYNSISFYLQYLNAATGNTCLAELIIDKTEDTGGNFVYYYGDFSGKFDISISSDKQNAYIISHVNNLKITLFDDYWRINTINIVPIDSIIVSKYNMDNVSIDDFNNYIKTRNHLPHLQPVIIGNRHYIYGFDTERNSPFAKFGTTEERPTGYLTIGTIYFDTTINAPIWWNGTEWVESGDSLPEGGTNGQVLTKTDDGYAWKDVQAGDTLPEGGTVGQVLKKTASGTEWADDKTVTVNNTLDSDSTTEALSAAQGKELKALVDSKLDSTTFKTINGEPITGTGDIEIQGGESYTLPVASDSILGGIKTGIYFKTINGGILTPGEYYGRYPGTGFSDCNEVITPGYYFTHSKPKNGPEEDDFPSSFNAAIHCLFLSQMSGAYYIQQLFFIYNYDAFYTRWCRVAEDSDTITYAGSWQRIAGSPKSGGTSEIASYGKLGKVQGYSGSELLIKSRYGFEISSSGEISIYPGSHRLPMTGYFDKNNEPADVAEGALIYNNNEKQFYIATQTTSGVAAKVSAIDNNDVPNVLTYNPFLAEDAVTIGLRYRSGSNMLPLYIVNAGSTENRPSFNAHHVGACYYDKDLKCPIWWDGTQWRFASEKATEEADGLMSKEDKVKLDSALTGDGVSSVKVVTEMPEEPDENTVYIIKG